LNNLGYIFRAPTYQNFQNHSHNHAIGKAECNISFPNWNIKKLLYDKPLDLALFTVGINTNLRAPDLLRIKVKLNKACVEAIQGLLASKECFNHSTQKQTLAYLCVQPEEIKNVYENEL
jgi:hypothetical protein